MATTRLVQRRRLNADINITNMIDLMMVLLVVFMIATPLLAKGMNIQLPQSSVSEVVTSSRQAILVEVDDSEKIKVNSTAVALADLGEIVLQLQQTYPGAPVNVRADSRLSWGLGVEILGLLREQGIANVGIETQPPSANGRD
jgi:biopolymer transport protein TolR